MTSLERIQATLRGEATDRRAVSLTLPLYGAKLTACALSVYYSDPEAYARGQSAALATFRPDILFGPFSLALHGAAFGSRVRFFDNQAPNLACPVVASVEGINQVRVPDVDHDPTLLYFREAIRLLAAEHGQEVPIAAITMSPVDLPAMILGLDGWLETLLFDEAGTKRVLDVTMPFFVRWANALLEDGAAFVVLPTVFANPTITSRQIAEEIAVPAMREAFSEVRGPLFLHYGGRTLNAALDLLRDLPNVVGFAPDTEDSLAEARQKVGPGPVLLGNVDGPSLFLREPEDIKAECLCVLNDRRDDPRFVLGTSAADIGFDTPPENIHAVREAAEEFAASAP